MATPSDRRTAGDARPTRRRVLRLAAVGGFTVAAGEGALGPVATAAAAPAAPAVLVAVWQPPPAYDRVVGVL